MEPLFAVCIMVFFTVVAFGMHFVKEKKRQESWANVAQRLRLQHEGNQLHGTMQDTVVRVWLETRGSGKNRTVWTLFSASIDGEVPLGLKLSREGWLVKLGKATGTVRDIQLDLPGIDEKLQVRAADEDEVRRWAQRADVSRALIDLTELSLAFVVHPHEIVLEHPGVIVDEVESQLEQLVHIARALSGKGYGALLDDGHW